MLTVLQYINYMKHAIGRTPAAGHDLYQTLNRAGRKLTDRFEWSWKVAGPVSLTSAVGDEGNNFVPLDTAHGFTGFKSIEAIEVDSRPVRLVSPAELHAIRIRGLSYTDPVFCLLTDTLPASVGASQPVPRIAFIDALAAGSAPAVIAQIVYRRGWMNVTSSNDAHVVPIPDSFEEALLQLARATAYGIEFDGEHPDKGRYEESIQLLIAQDTTQQPYWGQMRGGAGDVPAAIDQVNASGWGDGRPRIVGGP